MNIFKKLRFLWEVIEPHKYSVLLLFIVILVTALSETFGLGIILPLLEAIINPHNNSKGFIKYLRPILIHFPDYYKVMVICGLMGILILIKNIFFIIKTCLSASFVLRLQKLWSKVIMERYIHADYSFLLSKKQGTLINNLVIEPANAAKSLEQLIMLFSNIILSISFYSLLFFVSWKITLLITSVVIIIIILTKKTTYEYSIDVGRKRVALSQQLIAIGAENISAIRQIKTFSLESKASEKFNDKLDYFIQILLKFKIIHRLPRAITECLVMGSMISALLYFQYVSKVPIANLIPTLGLFIIVCERLFPMISQIYSNRMLILTLIPSLALINNLCYSNNNSEELNKGVFINQLRGDIIFEDVHFSYHKSNPLFQGLNIKIPRRKITAIIGPSGSGKSTIIDLLIGLHKYQSGKILINGFDLKEINLQSWRKLVGYVSQDIFLFNSTIRENILLGKPDASEEEIVIAARKANAGQFIRQLSGKYDTPVGDRGLKTSGGQRQRIAIARAIIRDPEVLIFDEATSALDLESEKFIHDTIACFANKKTIIIISHSLSIIKNADMIYVLDNGHIVKSGGFKELGDYPTIGA